MRNRAARIQLVEDIRKIVHDSTDDPGAELVKMGTALAEIGKTLQGSSLQECRSIIAAICALELGPEDKP